MKNLLSTFAVIEPDQKVVPIEVSPAIYEELDRRFENFRGRLLVASYEFTQDWPTWEMHPAGDEIVVLMSGSAEMVLDHDGDHRTTILDKPGSYVIVPKATWHTARVRARTTMLFITPGEGTQNKAIA